jgi:hypothetical protein
MDRPQAFPPNIQNAPAASVPSSTNSPGNVIQGPALNPGGAPADQAPISAVPSPADDNSSVTDLRPLVVDGLTFTAVCNVAKTNEDPVPGTVVIANNGLDQFPASSLAYPAT